MNNAIVVKWQVTDLPEANDRASLLKLINPEFTNTMLVVGSLAMKGTRFCPHSMVWLCLPPDDNGPMTPAPALCPRTAQESSSASPELPHPVSFHRWLPSNHKDRIQSE